MHRRIIILILVLALIFMIAYKQDWFSTAIDGDEQSNQTALAVNTEMQKAFDAGQAVWLVFSSAT